MRDFREFEAANDTEFKHQRHQTSQIPESITPIENYPRKLRIYLTNASPFWQVKCFFKNKTYTKSLRTTNRSVAKNAAKEFFHHTVAEIYGSSLTELTPKRLNKELLFSDSVEPTLAVERARVSRGEFSKAVEDNFQKLASIAKQHDNILYKEKKNIHKNSQAIEAPKSDRASVTLEHAIPSEKKSDLSAHLRDIDNQQSRQVNSTNLLVEDELHARVRKMKENISKVNQSLTDIEDDK